MSDGMAISQKARGTLEGLEDRGVRQRAIAVLDQMVDALNETDTSDMRRIWAYCDDDGAALIEWIFPDARLGFSIEPEPEEGESGWYIVAKAKAKGEDMICDHGYLSKAVVSDLVARFMEVVE